MRIPFYIGTYTSGLSKGIYRSILDVQEGQLEPPELVAEIDNPTFLTLHPRLNVLYSCGETRREGKREGSKIVAFRIEGGGGLTWLGQQPSGGSGPCYVSTNAAGSAVFVANYASGSIASFPLAADGNLDPVASHIQHTGKSVNPDRQEGPHAHCIVPDPTDHYVCAVDLGLDAIISYELDRLACTLAQPPAAKFRAQPGQGPRHIAFHPDGQHVFVINEMGNSITTCRWHAASGVMQPVSSVSTLQEPLQVENTTAEILVHPNGRFVYGSNRGDDSLMVYEFDNQSAQLTLVQRQASGGKTPRNFRLDPSGNYLLAANQDSDSIVLFKLDSGTGRISETGRSITVGKPCCIKFQALI